MSASPPACPSPDYVALVVGVANYTHQPVLPSCTREAVVVSSNLQQAGWHTVDCAADATGEQLAEAINTFADLSELAKASFFYFSGHGMQYVADSKHYLLGRDFRGEPPDKELTSREWKKELLTKAYSVQDLLDELRDKHCPLNILVLDCCRTLAGRTPNASAENWSRMQPLAAAGSSFLICWAVSSGQQAPAGANADQMSTFTSNMVKALFSLSPSRSVFDALTDAQDLTARQLGANRAPMLEHTSAKPFQALCIDGSKAGAGGPAAAPQARPPPPPRNCLRKPQAERLLGRCVGDFAAGLVRHGMLQLVAGPGEGKTEIAAAVGQRLWEEGVCKGGAFWLDLAGISNTKDAVQMALVAALAAQAQLERPLQCWEDVVCWAGGLAEPALLVLDNAECCMPAREGGGGQPGGCTSTPQLSKDLAIVLNQLHGCRQLRVVVTSRVELPLVARLPAAAVHNLQRLPEHEAHQLLHHHWRLQSPHPAERCAAGLEPQPERPDAPVARVGGAPREEALLPEGVTEGLWGSHEMGVHAGRLVQAVHCNPLLLVVAGSLIGSGRMTWQEVLRHAERSLLRITEHRAMGPYFDARPPVAAWLKAALTPAEQTCLVRLSGFVGSFSVGGAQAVQQQTADSQLPTGAACDTMLRNLAELCIVQRSGDARYVLHPLVRWVAQQVLPAAAQLRAAQGRFVEWMVQRKDGPGQLLFQHHPKSQQPQLGTCQQVMREEQMNLEEVGRLLPVAQEGEGASRSEWVQQVLNDTHWVCVGLEVLGAWGLAAKLREESLQLRAQVLGAEDPDTWTTKNHLAAAAWHLGQQDRSLQLYEEVLQARTKALGADHPDTLASKGNLAISLRQLGQGHLERALQLAEEVLEGHTKALGAEHLDTFASKANLASTLGQLGQLDRALRLHEEVVEGRTKALGANHPDTLNSKGNVATTLWQLGRRDRALPLQEEVLGELTMALGVDHPTTLGSKGNLALMLGRLGQLDRALQLHKEVLEARTKALGANHRDTLTSKKHLASTLMQLGRLERAFKLQQEVLDARTKVLGADHPDTLASKNDLATTLWLQGQLDRALQMYEEVLAARTTALGADHPDTLASKGNLPIMYIHSGQLKRAFQLQEEVLEECTKALGADHPQTLTNQGNLANMLLQMGELDRALPLQEQVLEARIRVLGADHPETLANKINLAGVLWQLGQLDRALRLEEEVLAARTTALGASHPDTMTSKANLATTLVQLGQLDRAQQLQEEVLAARTTALGAKHPDTMTSKADLATTLVQLGQLDHARQLQEEVLAARAMAPGANHPEPVAA